MERHTYNHAIYRVIALLADLFLIGTACRLAFYFSFGYDGVFYSPYNSYLIIFTLAWLGIASFNELYKRENIFDFDILTNRIPYTLFFQFLLLGVYLYLISPYNFSPRFVVLSLVMSAMSVVVVRFLMVTGYKYRRLLQRDLKVVIVGSGNSANELLDFFKSVKTQAYQYKELDNINRYHDPQFVRDQLANFREFCLRNQISEIYLAIPVPEPNILDMLLEFADNHYIYFKIVRDVKVLEKSSGRYIYLKEHDELSNMNQEDIIVDFYGAVPVITLKKHPLKPMLSRVAKRSFDFVFSALAILFFLIPAFIVIGILIRLESKGPIIFKQVRSGRKNQRFICYKFRTMFVRPPEESYQQATKNDPRITKIGAFLRKTSLDEIPQFLNVFLGHMSVVGPRPHPLPLNDVYAPQIERYLYRYFIMPGITGYAQVHGYRGETSDPSLMEKRVEYDTWYIENWSFWLDIKIILMTVWNAVKGEETAY